MMSEQNKSEKRKIFVPETRKRHLRRIAVISLVLAACITILFLAFRFSAFGFRPGPAVLKKLPSFNGEAYTVINNNIPFFRPDQITAHSYERYGKLDALGRCTVAVACLGRDLMPNEAREDISSVKPSGWKHTEYDFVDQYSLYNRCHLIAFMLAGENANEKNLITGTRFLNISGMNPFEARVSSYIHATGNHVMYRVTPFFRGFDLVSRGVLMEAYSVEDHGEGICFNVYCFNVQPGVKINYSDGSSRSDGTVTADSGSPPAAWHITSRKELEALTQDSGREFILNVSSGIIHLPNCEGVIGMNPANAYSIRTDLKDLLEAGYKPCGICKPDRSSP